MSRILPRLRPPAAEPPPPPAADVPPLPLDVPPPPPRTGRRALVVVALGALGVALMALPFFDYDLDRFYAPKELVLHLTALVALRSVLKRARGRVQRWEDGVLVALTALSALSAVQAVNPWLGLRALAVSTSSAALYVVGRVLARDGFRRELVGIVVAGAAAVAFTSVLQAFGVTSDLFSLARSPGGTLGNRNAVAHVAALALPLVVAGAFGARRARWALAALPVLMLLVGVIVVTRSRAAWVATVAVLVVFAVGAWLRRWEAPKARLLMLGGAALVGLGLALALPNALRWNSDSPYADSLRDLVNANEGSGRGRILQYQHTAEIARDRPLLGVGPGNWPVVYPAYAPPGDPSLSKATGMAMNPWPSSDLVATVAERGFVVGGLLGVFALLVGLGSLRRVRMASTDADAGAALARAGVLTAAVVCGGFDAVLLLPTPAFFVALALGALAPVTQPFVADETPRRRRLRRMLVGVVGGVFVLQSLGHVVAMGVQEYTDAATPVVLATVLDPGTYRLRMEAAERYRAERTCASAVEQARAALRLMPYADPPRVLIRRCGQRPPPKPTR